MAINKPILAIPSAQTRKDVRFVVVKVTGWDPLTQPYRFFRPPNPIGVEQIKSPDPAFCNEGYYPYIFADQTSGNGDSFALNITIDAAGVLSWEIYSSGSQEFRAGDLIGFSQSQLENQGIVNVDENAEAFLFRGPASLVPGAEVVWGISADLDNSFRWYFSADADSWLDSLPIGTSVQFTTESGYYHRAVTTSLSSVLPGTTNSKFISFANDPWPQEILDAFDNDESLTIGEISAGSLLFDVTRVDPPRMEEQKAQRVGQMILFKENPTETGTLYVVVEIDGELQWKPVLTSFTAFDLRTGEQWDPIANFYSPLVPYQR